MPKRGKPLTIDKNKVIEVLIKYKKYVIVLDNYKIISKCDKIWCTLSKEINDIITPNALYIFAVCNKHNIRNKLMSSFVAVDRNVSAL